MSRKTVILLTLLLFCAAASVPAQAGRHKEAPAKTVVAPDFPSGPSHGTDAVPTRHGKVSSEWTVDGSGRLSWTLTVPRKDSVEARVPLNFGSRLDGQAAGRLDGPARVFTLGPGTHHITGVPKRLVCMDLDGTLTEHRTPLTEPVKEALDRLGTHYYLLMVGGGNAKRIHKQMNGYPIEILGNYGMSHGKVVDGEWKIVRETSVPTDSAFFLEKTRYFRDKYGYTSYYGDPLEFHPSGMVTFGLLGTAAPVEEKLGFDVDKSKRRAMYDEVCKVFSDYSVFIGGTTSFDFTPKEYNKYAAIVKYASEHGYSLDEVIFFGDDMGPGGNDSHVRLGGLDYILVENYRDFPAQAAFLRGVDISAMYHDGWTDFNKNGVKDVYEDPTRNVSDRVEDLLSQMTVEEKTCQLVTVYGYGRVLPWALPAPEWKERVWKDGIANIDEHLNGVGNCLRDHYDLIYPFSNHVEALHKVQRFFVEQTRLGIPAEFSNEGIHGLNHTKATPLPAPIAIGSTWDRGLVLKAGRIAGHEASLLGYHSVYAPILDVARDQRWGRTVECYGEDPYLVGELGLQMALGIQSQGVASCLKHFAAYSVPAGGRDGRCRTDPQINPRDLHQIFLQPFEKVVSKAHPMEVMSSYNDWNGEPVSASYHFLTELLRQTYGFDGYVVSDSNAVEYMYTKHQIVPDMEGAAKAVLEAGLNVRTNFQQPESFVEPLRKAIAKGDISMETIDSRVREVLSVKFRLGLFDNPYTGNGAEADRTVGMDNKENSDFVLRTALESLVLLKNEGGLLPLDPDGKQKILVTGPLADATGYMISRYGPNGLDCVTMLQGIREIAGGRVSYSKGCEVTDALWPESEILPQPLSADERRMMDEAVTAARESDIVIAVMGEDGKCVGESLSRTSLDLPGRQRQLLQELYATGKPVILVLVNGQPLTINWENATLPAILEAWFPNNYGGTAVASALFGKYNPGGRLSVTFPKSIGQIPYTFPYKKGSHGDQPAKGPNGGGKTRVLGSIYPFGYGLSYTNFEYSDLTVDKLGDGRFAIGCTVTNAGKLAGDEVVQLYLQDKVSSLVAYESVLRGFERISLAPGESRHLSFEIGPGDMRMMDRDMKWTVESGDFEVRIGASSEDIRLRSVITVD